MEQLEVLDATSAAHAAEVERIPLDADNELVVIYTDGKWRVWFFHNDTPTAIIGDGDGVPLVHLLGPSGDIEHSVTRLPGVGLALLGKRNKMTVIDPPTVEEFLEEIDNG